MNAETSTPTNASSGSQRRRALPSWLPFAMVIALGVMAYGGSLRGAFLLDDMSEIVANPAVHDLSDLGAVLGDRRPLVALSFAINYAIAAPPAGEPPDPAGFHVLNIAVHLCCALLLMAVVRRCAALSGVATNRAIWLGVMVASLWVVHPLTTQAVTYVTQRSESMMAALYLLTMYATLRIPDGRRWMIIGIVACAAGMLCKTVMITAPIAAIMMDRAFVARSWKTLVSTHGVFHAGLLLTIAIPFATGVAPGILATEASANANVGFAYKGIAPLEYLYTQANVIMRYLRLTFSPTDLHVLYDYPVATTLGAAMPALAIVAMLVVGSIVLLWRAPRWGVPAAMFFLILGPTSSIVPIRDVIFEHRMYLPLACIVVLVSCSAVRLVTLASSHLSVPSLLLYRPLAVGWSLLVFICIFMTAGRNRLYQVPATLWQQTVNAQPNNYRAYILLAQSHMERGESAAAIPAYERGRELALERPEGDVKPRDFINTIISLGIAKTDTGDIVGAEKEYDRALRRDPDNRIALYNYSILLARQGPRRYDRAIDLAVQLTRRQPTWIRGYEHLADLRLRNPAGRDTAGAIEAFRAGLEAQPDNESVRTTLAGLKLSIGETDGVEALLQRSLELNPRSVAALHNYGLLCERSGRTDEALQLYRSALQIQPDFAATITRLAILEGTTGP
ncbi:MAG: tetratricopeptide repeat protein [Planctomycetota bacterium]